jgi:type IV pilus assembly protein PilN
MIRINLLPVREVEEASSRRKELLLAGGLIAVTLAAVVSVHFFQAIRINSISTELADLESALVKIRQQNKDLERMEQQKKDLEDKIRVVRQLTSAERRTASVHILDDLSSSTPDQLWLTDFTETKGAAKISGKAVDNQTIASFAHNLSSSRYFQKIEIRETAQEVQTADADRRTAVGRTRQQDSPLGVLMTRFLIEASVNYLPSMTPGSSAEGQGRREEAGNRGEQVRKKPK